MRGFSADLYLLKYCVCVSFESSLLKLKLEVI